jgi:hypothetical protein
MNVHRLVPIVALAAAVAAFVQPAAGDPFAGGASIGGGSFTPRVPVSPLARPMAWFDPSRLHLSTSVSVGSGFGGTSSGLQVTRLSYNFQAPISMSVSVGNSFGSSLRSGQSSMFLEGLDLAYHPNSSMFFQVHYQDFRSPLQYGNRGFGWGDPYPYGIR